MVRGRAGVFGQTKTLPARRHERVRRVPLGTRRYVRRRLWLRSTYDIGSGIIPQPDRGGQRISGPRMRDCAGEQAPPSWCPRRRGRRLAYATWRFVASRASATDGPAFEPQPFPMPPRPVAARPVPAPAPATVTTPTHPEPDVVEPDVDGNCPLTHPIKGKLSTGIYHRPARSRTTGPAPTAATATTTRPKRTDSARPSADRDPFPRRSAGPTVPPPRRRRRTCSRISRSSSRRATCSTWPLP